MIKPILGLCGKVLLVGDLCEQAPEASPKLDIAGGEGREEGVFSFVSVSHYLTLFLISSKVN